MLINKNIYFVHIPRTGGRYVHRLLAENGHQVSVNQESFNDYINNMIFNDYSNWYSPQINFLNKDLKIYRFEDSLGPTFNKWLEDNLNLKIKKEFHNNYDYSENLVSLTEKQKELVKNYYYKDYKFLEY